MKRWHGLTWRGWALFVPACALAFCAVFWGTLQVAAVVDPGAPAITLSPAATSQPAPNLRVSSPARRHPGHRATHRASQRAVAPQQPLIPGVGSTGGPGVTSVPPPTHYRAPAPPPASVAPVTITPIPGPSTPAPPPSTEAPPPSTEAPPPSSPPDTSAAPTAPAAASGPGWGQQKVVPQVLPAAPSTLPDVPGGGSGWVPGG